jgi:hypothetical protein
MYAPSLFLIIQENLGHLLTQIVVVASTITWMLTKCDISDHTVASRSVNDRENVLLRLLPYVTHCLKHSPKTGILLLK